MKVWADDDPKAGLMARKRALIVDAALQAFLEAGYAASSVNRIAAAAGVSIKTLYRHFENKVDLFGAVMKAACDASPDAVDDALLDAWRRQPPAQALVWAGENALRHTLSDSQLALYRVVARDAQAFPELGATYRREVTGRRDAAIAGYLAQWTPEMGWPLRDPAAAAAAFSALLRAGLHEPALLQGIRPSEAEVQARARTTTTQLLTLIEKGLF